MSMHLRPDRGSFWRRLRWIVPALMAALGAPSAARAALPPPANDTPGAGQVIAALPAVVTGSNVNGDNTINVTTIGSLPSVPGPDVFFKFTPPSNGSYWVMMIPWVQVPAYGSTGLTVPDPNLCVYVRNSSTLNFVNGSDANGRDLPDTTIVSLIGGVTYDIVVDSTSSEARRNQFEFTLVVAAAPVGSADNCASGAEIEYAELTAAVGTLTGAAHDFAFVESVGGRCDLGSNNGLAVNGIDHVYSFTTPKDPGAAGDYLVSLVSAGPGWNGIVYVADSCPPFFPLGCLGGANNATFTPPHAESVAVTLDFDKTYYIYVDSGSTSLADGKYAVLIERAEAAGIDEVEPNETTAAASALSASAQNGGQLLGPNDFDHWSLALSADDKLFVMADNGNTLLTGIDLELRLINTDGVGLMELDDDDGEGAVSPYASYTLRTSSRAGVLAGSPIPANGSYFLRLNGSTAADVISRYFLHYGVEPAGRVPSPECEPNDALNNADGGAKHYFSGVISDANYSDHFRFTAAAGDRVFVALDGDPERDSGGDFTDDPDSLDGALRVFDPAGDILIDDVDDPNVVEAAQIPDYPAEGLFFVAPSAGVYTVRVTGGGASDFGPGRTYNLAVFLDDAAPALSEDVDPAVDSVTPDFVNDDLTVSVSDDAVGDSGICGVALSADSVNIVLSGLSFSPGDPTTTFDVVLITPGQSGRGKVMVTDCAGNTACREVIIDADDPLCGGSASSGSRRTFRSTHAPIHVPDNQPAGPGIDGVIAVPDPGVIADVNVTISVETLRPLDVDVFLRSPAGTIIELVTDRGGLTGALDITDATFDDSASELMSLLSSDAPYTGTWLPEQPGGLALLNGQAALGNWALNVRDDASSGTGAGGGARLVTWSLDIDAGYASPPEFNGTADDSAGFGGGIASVVLSGGVNVTLTVDPAFAPGDLTASFVVQLVNPSQNGTGTVVITDNSDNICNVPVNLTGLADAAAPSNSGSTSRNLVLGDEVQGVVAGADPAGVVSTVVVPQSFQIGEVETDITIDTLDVGRIASTLTHAGEFAALVNRVGMTERGSVGLTKDNIELNLDDDAPLADDAHLEPALGTIEFLGLHQPDGRGEFIGEGISSDPRDNMLFAFEGQAASGGWDLYVADFRLQGAESVVARFRRWGATLKSPGGPERYAGTARDTRPGAGICSIALAGGAVNLAVSSSFAAGDESATYTVELVDPALPGSGTVNISDCAGNVTMVPISLGARSADQSLPVISGSLNGLLEFEGTATDNQAGDSGIASVTLAPHSTNLQLVSVTPDPPGGAGSVDFVVSRVDTGQNSYGYVRVTDVTGWRRHYRIVIDGSAPLCSGSARQTKRYRSTDLPQPLPDNNAGGVFSTIVVPDAAVISDVDVTVHVSHTFDDDIQAALTNPVPITLWGDIGSTGNDFFNTTIDDEAAGPMPDSSAAAPFDGSFQPVGGPALFVLDGGLAAGAYTLKVFDDAVFNTGSFDSWAITIESASFPERFAGVARDQELMAAGISTIELLPGSCNLALNTDPFSPGARFVNFEAVLVDPAGCGRGTVRITDGSGNFCDTVVNLSAPFCTGGDLNHDGSVTPADVPDFVQALLFGSDNCEADVNGDGDVNGDDVQPFVDAL